MIKEFVTNKLKNSLGLYDLGELLEILEEQKKSIEEKNKRNVKLLKDTYEEKIDELNQKNNEIENIKHELTVLYTKLMFMKRKGKFNYLSCLKEIEGIIERCK